MKKERTEECISVIDDLLELLEADRGWLDVGSRENVGFLRAMEAVKEKRDALERSKEKWKNDVSREEKVKMNKERTKVGDIRISKRTKKPIICTGVEYTATGNEESRWASYKKNLLKIKMGMSPESLQHFIDMFDVNQPVKQIRDIIKIRYAYIASLTNVKEDPFYKEYLTFRTLALNDLETSHDTLEDLLTLDTTTLIKILGRDICTGRIDMEGKDIYTGDLIRWYIEDRKQVHDDETVDAHTHFYEQDLTSKRECKVIGTIYDKEGI